MKKVVLFTVLVNVLAALGATAALAGVKVDVCHIPPGNPANFVDQGAIIGGTGRFRGASGEYSDVATDDPSIRSATFDFDERNGGKSDDDD